jgi:hypothetical protein
MKFNLFLLLLTTLAAVALASNYDATGNVTCTADSCIFTVYIIDEKTFNGTTIPFGKGIAIYSGQVAVSENLNLLYASTSFFYILEPTTATINFIDKNGEKVGTYTATKDNHELTGSGPGAGTWK